MIIKRVFENIFNADVLFIGDCDADVLDEYLEKNYGLPSDGFYQSKEGAVIVIEKKEAGITFVIYALWLRDKTKLYTLSHECLHLVQKIFKDRGVPFTDENAETVAYYQDFWFKYFWELVNKKKKKKV